jgi:hypothetical protein
VGTVKIMNFLGLSQSFLSVGFVTSLGFFSIMRLLNGDSSLTKTLRSVKKHLEERFSSRTWWKSRAAINSEMLFGTKKNPAGPWPAYRPGSITVTPLFGGNRRRLDISAEGALPCKEIVDRVRLSVRWDKFCHGLAMLCDYDSFMLSLNLVHDREAICLEESEHGFG